MAFRNDTLGERLFRTTSLPSSTNFSACGWARWDTGFDAGHGFNMLCDIANATSSASNWMEIGFRDSGATFALTTHAGNTAFGSNPALDVWFFWAMSCAGTGSTDFKGYWSQANSSTFNTAQRTGYSFTTAQVTLTNDTYTSWMDGRMAYVKMWDAVLTQAEFEAEKWRGLPARWANLHGFWPLFDSATGLQDFTPGAKTLSSSGTLAWVDQPPASWGAPVITRQSSVVPLQTARPVSDVAVNNWTVSPLWDKIDEVTPDDATTLISSPANPTAEACTVQYGSMNTAPAGAYVWRYRYRKNVTSGTGQTINLTVTLQNSDGSTIVTRTHNNISTDWVTQRYELNDTDKAAINAATWAAGFRMNSSASAA